MRPNPGLRARLDRHPAAGAEVVVLDQSRAWNSFVAGHRAGTPYHRYEWLELMRRSFGYRPVPLAAISDRRVVGVLPLVLVESWWAGRSLISVPFADAGGALARHPEIEQALWDRAVEVAVDEGARYLEVRRDSLATDAAGRPEQPVAWVGNLMPTIPAQWKHAGVRLRNRIRAAQLSGLAVASGGIAHLNAFYEVFARAGRNVGRPAPGRAFFRDLLDTFPDSARIFLVAEQDATIAGAVAMAYQGTLEVRWTAWRSDCVARGCVHRLYWELMQHGVRAGLKRIVFGRGLPGHGRGFVEQWGARAVPQAWEYWTATGRRPPERRLSLGAPWRAAARLWQCIPVCLADRLNPFIIRHLP